MLDLFSPILIQKNRLRLRMKFIAQFGRDRELRKVLDSYLSDQTFEAQKLEKHLGSAMQWLLTAQKACSEKGVAAKFAVSQGWTTAYPETSGYIISTYLAYHRLTSNDLFLRKAIELGDWECDIQTSSGAILSDMNGTNVRVFNTGQVMLGWCDLYERTKDSKYLEAARKAGNFLVQTQEANGSWTQNTYCGARTYHARVAWPLLRLSDLTGDKSFETVAKKNLDWVISCAQPNGWFANCGFDNDDPITHVLDYTLRGLLESHILRPQWNLLPYVEKAIRPWMKEVKENPVFKIPGMVPHSFDHNWKGDSSTSCLTGNAQFAYLLYRLHQVAPNQEYVDLADQILLATQKTQVVNSQDERLTGAIPGCFPFYYGYCHNSFPNWATKFFADAIMMKLNHSNNFSIPA